MRQGASSSEFSDERSQRSYDNDVTALNRGSRTERSGVNSSSTLPTSSLQERAPPHELQYMQNSQTDYPVPPPTPPPEPKNGPKKNKPKRLVFQHSYSCYLFMVFS